MLYILSFASAFFAGITSILAKIGIKNSDSDLATAIRTVVILIFSIIVVFLTGANSKINTIEMKNYIYLGISGILTGLAWIFYFKALQIGNINKVIPIDKSSTAIAILLGMLIFKNGINVKDIIMAFSIGIGTLMMVEKKDIKSESKDNKWFIYAILSAVFSALTNIVAKIGLQDIDSNLGTAIRTVFILIMSWVMVYIKSKYVKLSKPTKKDLVFICLSGIATGMSWICFFRALQMGFTEVLYIDKLSFFVTIGFSYIVFKEKISKKAFVGMLLIVFAPLIPYLI